MVGKLNLALGNNYAFDIRRARYVAEVIATAELADASGVPDPVPAGGEILLQWTAAVSGADGVSSGQQVAETPKAEVMEALAHNAQRLFEIEAAAWAPARDGIALAPIASEAPLTDVSMTYTPPGAP